MHLFKKSQPTMMSKKYHSMLLGGTLTMMVVSILLMSDSIIAGAVIGPDAVAAITLVTPLYALGAFFGSVLSIGVPILYTTEMGKFNKERADQIFGFGVLASIIVGIVLFFLASQFGNMYLCSSSPSEAVLEYAEGYLFWMRFTILILPIQQLILNAVYSDGDERISTIGSVAQGVGNIVLSIILSRLMGTAGIGLASFVFYMVSLLIMLFHFRKETNSLRWNLYYSFDILKRVVRYSIIDSSSYLFLGAFTGALNAFVGNQFGPEYLILVSAIVLSREFQLLFDGIGVAVGPIFSVYIGEKSHSGLRSAFTLARKTAVVEGIAVMLVLLAFAPVVPTVLHVEQAELARWIVAGIRLTALGTTFVSLLYLLTSYYLVIGQIFLGVVVCALRDVALSVCLAAGLGKVLGVWGFFIGLAVAPVLAYALLMVYLTARYGRKECPMLLSRVPGYADNYLFNLSTEPEDIIAVQRKVETILKEHDVDRQIVGQTMLLIEEAYMLIRQMNDDKAVLAECTVNLKPEGVQIISKDDGVSFDMADEDVGIRTLGAYTLARYLEKEDFDNRHLTTMSLNRSAFLIRGQIRKIQYSTHN